MNWQKIVSDYLTFTRRDRIAIIVILGIMAAAFFLPKINAGTNHKSEYQNPDTAWIAAMKRLEIKMDNNDVKETLEDGDNNSYQYDKRSGHYTAGTKGELFYFDPNNLSAEGWKKLGLREKTINTIRNYLSKGGKFKKPEDLKKIYGLFPDEYNRIAAYIRITSNENPTFKQEDFQPTGNTSAGNYRPKYASVDINTADTTAFIALPGIGSKLAARIVNFRDKLGGFYAVSQVAETYGLPDSTYQKIRQYLTPGITPVKKININTATVDELKTHPYIKFNIANLIVAYRNQHGPFMKPEDLKKVMAITEDVYTKILPYLTE
jgi:competence protein ComEA